MHRERAASYPPKASAPVVYSRDTFDQTTTETVPDNPPNPDHHLIDPPDAIYAKTNPRLARLANRSVMSGSGTVYTLFPCAALTQDPHGIPMDVEDPRPPLPDSRPASPIADVELYEGSPSGGVKPPTLQGGVPVSDDDEVVAIAKKILEKYKKASGKPETGGEEEG